MSDLQILFPEPVIASVDGMIVEINPVRVEDFEKFGEAAAKIIHVAASGKVEEIYALAKKSGGLKRVLGACTSLNWWQRRRMPAASAVLLMLHVIRINNDFFAEALAGLKQESR